MKPMSLYQRGMELWDTMLIVAAIAFCAGWVIKFGPYYSDDRSISTTIENVRESMKGQDIEEISSDDIRSRLGKQFSINQLDEKVLSQLKIVHENKKVLVQLDYEVRSPFIGNIDLVFRFHHLVDLAAAPE